MTTSGETRNDYNTIIDFEAGEEAVKVLFEELGEDFVNRYEKIKDLIMQKRIGQDYLLSRKLSCSNPKFMENYAKLDDDLFSLLTTDLAIRSEAVFYILKKQTGIDVMKRFTEIKLSIIKRKLRKKRKIRKKLCLNEIYRKESFTPVYLLLKMINSVTKIIERLIFSIKHVYSILSKHFWTVFEFLKEIS